MALLTIDDKIKRLLNITTEFIFIEYYPHTKVDMYKILNEYTEYGQEKLVLCSIDDGIELALNSAYKQILEKKKKHLDK